jgi:hypothetical protein
MKSAVVCFVVVLLSAALWAQAAPAATPAPQAPAATPAKPMHHHAHAMGGMRDQHMQEMKAQVEKMRATLEQMKANLAKVKDPALKQQSQLDSDLWEGMVKHMEGMVSMMSGHEGMGMGMMHDDMHGGMGGGMECCKDMKEGGGCCGGNKCMQGPPKPAEEKTPAPSL